MNCFHPIVIRNPKVPSKLREVNRSLYIQVDCKKCVACIRKKSRSIAFKLDCEKFTSSQPVLWLTLTYDDEHCPPELSRDHIKLFMKSLRQSYLNKFVNKYFGCSIRTFMKYSDRFDREILPKLKYWYCGEYGEEFGRPHYHLFLFGFDENVMNFDTLEKIWNNGYVYFGDAENGSEVYSTLYSFVNLLNDDFNDRVKPFCVSSTNLGIDWLEKNKAYILAHPDKPYLERQGVKYAFPDSFRRYLKNKYDFSFDVDIDDAKQYNIRRYVNVYRPRSPADLAIGYNSYIESVEQAEIQKLLRMKKHLNH